MIRSEFLVTHVLVETDRTFAEVTKGFESQLGQFDPAALEARRPVRSTPGRSEAESRRWPGRAA